MGKTAKEAHIIFNDGTQDWIDPVLSVEEFGDKYTIDNGFYKYDYYKDEIKSIEYKDIEVK